jgi:hypothetical protein
MNNYNYETLRSKNAEELKAIATGLGLGTPEGEKRQALLSRILEVTAQISPERPKSPERDYSVGEEVHTLSVNELAPHTQGCSISSLEEGILSALEKHIERGLNVEFKDNCFHMRAGSKQDSGTIRQPLKVIVRCADALVRV